MVEENGGPLQPNHEKINRKEVQGCHCWTAFNKLLIRFFAAFGRQVALRPVYFIVIPIVISGILATGIPQMRVLDDPILLFVPDTSPFIKEHEIVKSHFHMDYTNAYSQSRMTDFIGYSRVYVTAKDGGSIFRQILWPEIADLNYKISNITAEDELGEFTYEDICGRMDGYCLEHVALNLYHYIGAIENGSMQLTYPINLFPFMLPQYLGGTTVNESEGVITDAKSIVLMYFEITEPQVMLNRSMEWERVLIENLKTLEYEHIDISFLASRSLQDELIIKMNSALPFAPLTGFFMVVTCMVLLWMKDSVRSKPYIGIIGIISAVMASCAGFGFLIYVGAIYTRLNIIAVFLVLGIGVDDIFVAISAWQKTDPKDSVPTRMAKTYGDAAVSVTITSLTNCLSFAIGSTTRIIIVQNFCLYSAVTIVFAYFWFITFCGGFLAIAGYMEEKRRHSLFFVKVKPQNNLEGEKDVGFLKRVFFSSDLVERDANPTHEVKPHWVSVFFRDKVGDLLCNQYFRIFAAISLVVYLTGAIIGCIYLKQGLYRYRMSRDDSYLNDFHKYDNKYYRELPYAIQVVVSGNLTYSDPQTQQDLLELVKQFESTKYNSTPLFTQMWLKGYLNEYKRNKDWQEKVVDDESLIKVLREEYFINPTNEQALDLDYNENFTKIEASRFVIQTANVKTIYEDVDVMETFRHIAQESKFNVTVFHVLFSLFDQHYLLRPMAMQSIIIASIIVMLVSLFFIPNISGAIAIAFSIISIAAGVMGYMGFWGINLDQVSVGSIFMCIGFSVDFSAHITYTYLSSHETTSEGKIRSSLFGLGLPIMQGGITTILSLATFLMIPGYGYRTFFKTIFLVTIFAIYFSIVLIPLLLALLDYLFAKNRKVETEAVSGINYTRKPGSFKIPRISNGSLTKVNLNGHKNGTSDYENSKQNGSKPYTNGVHHRQNGGVDNVAFTE